MKMHIFMPCRMAGADHAVESAANLKGWQRYFNAVTIKGRRNVRTIKKLLL